MASIGTGMAQRKWTSEWFFNICCARNYLRSDQYVFFALQYSVVYGPKNSNGAVMCPTSIVYSKHSNRSVTVLYGKRKKKNPPQHNSHTYRRTMDPLSRECRPPKSMMIILSRTQITGNGIFGSQSLVNAPFLSLINRAHDATHMQWSPCLCCLHSGVHYPPYCCELFPLPNNPTNSQVPSMDFCTEEQWSGRFLGIIGCDPSVCKSSWWLHVDIPPWFPLWNWGIFHIFL